MAKRFSEDFFKIPTPLTLKERILVEKSTSGDEYFVTFKEIVDLIIIQALLYPGLPTYSVTDPLRIEFDSSLGYSLGPGEETIITARLFSGWADLTNYVTSVTWTRFTGDAPDDLVWNIAHAGWGCQETISYDDLGSTINTATKCIFTLTIIFDNEGVSQTIAQELIL